jgi:nucleoside-diphosphate-sugar epimerase
MNYGNQAKRPGKPGNKIFMNILIIGNLGYIGPMVVKHFKSHHPGAVIAGYDIGYFIQNYTPNGIVGDTLLDKQFYGDVRHFDAGILTGFDAVIYLAAISNDPMGNAFEKPTLDINFHEAVIIAAMAKKMGVKHFVFASSCSVYGSADTAPRTEQSELNPLTAYAKSKVFAEQGLEPLAGEDFQVTCLRFATACGYSDRLRLDLVLNDFVASAITDKKISILSDGTPWRPLIHVKDMARAMDWAVHRKEDDHFLVINTGSNQWNYQVKELAQAVQQLFTDVEVSINPHAQPDKRSYKVSFDLFEKLAPQHQPQVSLPEAVEDLKNGLQSSGFNDKNFRQSDLVRLRSIQKLIDKKIVDENLFIIKK